jgi:hypothetical protein
MSRFVVAALFWFAIESPPFVVAAEPKPASASKTAAIPLNEIWASYMPGTRDIHTSEPDVFTSTTSDPPAAELASKSFINRIAAKLEPAPTKADGPAVAPTPRKAFAVMGNGVEALKAASEQFDQVEAPEQSFPAGKEISVVFFSYQAGSRVELLSAERNGHRVEIKYRFVSEGLLMSTSHLALIPLGRLAAGEYQVQFKQEPMATRPGAKSGSKINEEWGQRLICKPFSFSIVGADKQ